MKDLTLKRIASYILSIVIIFSVWILIAKKVNSSLIVPFPLEVIKIIFKLIKSPFFWDNFFATIGRCFVSFFISLFLGIIIGFMCGTSDFFNYFFEIPLSIIRATPVIAFILVVIFWFKSGTVPIFVSIMMTLPIIVSAVATGFSKSDKKLLEMADCFELSKKNTFLYIKLPQSIPFILNGALSSFGLTWKVVVAGEVLCLPEKATGTLLQRYQIHLESGYIIAVTFLLTFSSFLLQELFSFLIKKYLSHKKV